MSLRVKLLGSLNIEDEAGAPSELMKWQKGCALFAYLLVTGRPQNREHLADLLWNSPSTTQSFQNLRKLLSRMRRWLPRLEVTNKLVAYPAETAVAIDLLSLNTTLASGTVAEMDAMLPLYAGDLLDGFYLHNAPSFNEWLLLEREKLRQQITAAYRQVCFAYAEQEAWPQGIAATQRWFALDQLNEEALRSLLKFLAASGQINVALQQYEISQQKIRQMLAVEPAPETVQLAQRLYQLKKEQQGGLSWSKIVGAQVERPSPNQLSAPGELPFNALLPYQRNNDFVGRRDSLLFLANRLLPNDNKERERAVCVSGMGGLGKTQLAVEFCYRYGRYFPGGIFWLSFADPENVASEVAAVGSERGLGLFCDADRLMQSDKVGRVVKAWQETIPRLLIFDNCEDESLLAKWLPVTGGCRVLLTSRRADWSRGLHISAWPLPVLNLPHSKALLQQLAPTLSEDEATNIAKELGQLPLALHLAGGFLHRYQQISGTQYLSQLNDKGLIQHHSLKGRGIRFSPTGHELNVARTFSLNFEKLDSVEEKDAVAKQILALVAAFAPGEPIPQPLLLSAIMKEGVGNGDEVMGTLLFQEGLSQLITLGLLEEKGRGVIVMHRLVVAFVKQTLLKEKLNKGQRTIEKVLIDALAKQQEESWGLAILPFSPSHLHHLADKVQTRADKQAAHLVNLWAGYLRDSGAFQEAEKQYQLSLNIHTRWVGRRHLETANCLRLLGNLYIRMGNYQQAQRYLDRALTIFEAWRPDNGLTLATVLDQLGLSQMAQSSYENARLYMERALSIRKQISNLDQLAVDGSLTNLGILHLHRGGYDKAKLILTQALNASEILYDANHLQTATNLNYLGDTYLYLNDYETALSMNEQALKIREQLVGSRHVTTAFSLESLGRIFLMTGRWVEAKQYLENALTIRQHSQGVAHPKTAVSLNHLGDLFVKMGEARAGQLLLEEALSIREQHLNSKHPDFAHNLISLADLHQATGDEQLATTYYERALCILEEKVLDTHFDLRRVRMIMEYR